MVARKFLISGQVQGVGYRYFAQRSAARHQVRGYVTAKQVDEFKHDLIAGPSFSKVDEIEETVLEPTSGYSAFRIER